MEKLKEEQKLILALIQVKNLTSLLEGNEYEKFLYGKLIGIQIELERQLNCLTNTNPYTKIKE